MSEHTSSDYLHKTFSFLKQACGGTYHFAKGQVYCRNESMMAGAPTPIQSLIPIDFNVPQSELEDILRRIEEPEMSFDGEELQIRGGRLRAFIKSDRDEPPSISSAPNEWQTLPDKLIKALEMGQCFTDDGIRWSAGIRLMDGRVTAISNTGGIDVSVPKLTGRPVLITSDTAGFLCNDPPEEIAISNNAIHGRWADGRWFRAQLMSAEMPAQVDQVFDTAKGPALIDINDEWRDAFDDAAALTKSIVELRPGGFYFARGVGQGEAEFISGLPEDHRSMWSAKVLKPVIQYAARWNPNGYPDPILFEGDGFRGVVVGQR